jgi:predicted anti-sigma-YlaC factor YlaD
MSRPDEEYRILISGYLDDELEPEIRAELEAHLEDCPKCRREFDTMKRLFWGTSAAVAADDLPEETWDEFLDNVYNRLERKTGWVVFVFGVLCLTLFGTYVFLMEPWTSALIKLMVATPVAGLAILFVSVLRQRLENLKTDRYTREIHR